MALGDAQDNVVGSNEAQVVQLDSIPNVPAFPTQQNPGRISQQRIAPAAVVGRLTAPIQKFSLLTTPVALVPNGGSVINTTITENQQQEYILEIVSRQVYIGNPGSAFLMPEQLSSSIFPNYEWESLYDQTLSYIGDQPWKACHKIQVRNNSGSTQPIWFQLLVKYITNRSNGGQRA